MSAFFPHLFAPLHLRHLELKNRVVCLPHGTAFGEDNLPTPRNVAYYRDRARGGAGLIITEATPVHPTGVNHPRKFAIYDQRAMPMLRQLTDAVHQEGVPVVAQLFHIGRAHSAFHQRRELWAPSAIPAPGVLEVPHEMDADDIAELIAAFAQSAVHASRAGYDGVEVHAANGTLLQQFLSPWSNRREDAYGGSPESRQRLVLEVVDAVRRAVGQQAVVGIRICGDELIPDGYDDAQMKAFARALEQTAQLDYVSVTAGVRGMYVGDATVPYGAVVYLAEMIKKTLGLPVITAMRIRSPRLAEDILAAGRADLVGLARALIADPEWPNKARAGRADEIRYCTGALQECRRAHPKVGRIACAVNAAVSEEETLGIGTFTPAAQPKRVVVVGGGPAGLEAARVAALRGHQVTLLERADELGGQLRVMTRIPALAEFGELTAFLTHQLQKLGVDVHLRSEATPEAVLALRPDAVIVATGSCPALPELPGTGPETALTAHAALEGTVPGPHVVVVDAFGGWETCGTAEVLARRGLRVSVVSPLRWIGVDIPFESLGALYERLAERAVVLRPMAAVEALVGRTLRCRDTYSGSPILFEEVSALVFTSTSRAQDALYKALKGQVATVLRAGDAVAPRKVGDAIREGHHAGRAA
ncbi:MAG: FAD-dependent oxidoreductase [Chloroflexi bacterium]|nr:FAD-dependent oxidoreductase [Chloroflexota bacterium]